MSSDDHGGQRAFQPIDKAVYQRANAEIETITARMPRKAVEALAREVVSRLAGRAMQTGNRSVDDTKYDQPGETEIEDLAYDLLRADPDSAFRRVERLRVSGATMSQIYLNHLALAARLLGDWWDADRVTFVEVTVGAGRIYAIMRALRSSFIAHDPELRRHAVFATVPGESHSLGVSMAADLFRERGWQIDLITSKDHDELIAALEDAQCLLIGLSASGLRSLTNTARLIVAVRIAVPGALILVSGKIVDEQPNIVGIVGADRAASDFESAYQGLEELLTQKSTVEKRRSH